MNGEKLAPDYEKEFLQVLKSDDVAGQYELLTYCIQHPEAASAVIAAIQEVTAESQTTGEPGAAPSLSWSDIRRDVTRGSLFTRFLANIAWVPTPQVIRMCLVTLMIGCSVMASLIFRAVLASSSPQIEIPGTVFLGSFLSALALLSAVALITEPVPLQIHRPSRPKWFGALSITAFAMTTVVLLCVGLALKTSIDYHWFPVKGAEGRREFWSGFVSPRHPAVISLPALEGPEAKTFTLTVVSSNPKAEVSVRVVDEEGNVVATKQGRELVSTAFRSSSITAAPHVELKASAKTTLTVAAVPSTVEVMTRKSGGS